MAVAQREVVAVNLKSMTNWAPCLKEAEKSRWSHLDRTPLAKVVCPAGGDAPEFSSASNALIGVLYSQDRYNGIMAGIAGSKSVGLGGRLRQHLEACLPSD